MPKRSDINSVLVIGAGPIVIGQACEFDYSGTQACRALREEGVRVALLNSNPATIMTDPDLADATYIEPVDADTAMAIIGKEKPDAVLPTMGGQTALNCAMELAKRGVFGGDGPELIGAGAESINKAEDRSAFKKAMAKIGLRCAPSAIVGDMLQARAALPEVGFPVIVRPSFTLGGSGGGIAYNTDEFDILAARGLAESPSGTILMERSLLGWKEFELEVVRDKADNCIVVCSIENVDPMGVHTGDSITVAPVQTLTDKEYQKMRDAAIAVLREIGVDTGGANVQFAVNPANGEMAVIEMNPRVSRSSALASKATGFPIAKVAAKLALGYTLDEIKNDITAGKTPASFEPSLDYIVVKAPRFDFAKFAPTPDELTTQMRSVGEVMAIGGTFAEALQKAMRGLESGGDWLGGADESIDAETLEAMCRKPNSRRLYYVAAALAGGIDAEVVSDWSGIDPWFVREIAKLLDARKALPMLKTMRAKSGRAAFLRRAKGQGFADSQIASAAGIGEAKVRKWRDEENIRPVYKRIDTCAGEFPTDTAYLYSTYADECELHAGDGKKIIILGSGPNRIGQGIEFDYCCVHGVMALKAAGFETIMINCNPETVSTDYDVADRLFFEPLTAEDVGEIIRREKPAGVIVQFGGQTPLAIAKALQESGAPIIGTSVDAIDRAESRERFRKLLQKLGLRQPQNAAVRIGKNASEDANKWRRAAKRIGYPLVVRPSYVLGGRAMRMVYDDDELASYCADASPGGEILLDKFLPDAIEVDVDAVRDADGDCLIAGVMEHIERAGIHSGDSACSLPPHSLSPAVVAELKKQTRALAAGLGVVGLMNVQFAVSGGGVYVLEVNPRASRTAPFVSKAAGLPVAKIAALAMAGQTLKQQGAVEKTPKHFAVKEAVFPFNKFPEVDVLLGPEMKSTGEAMGIGRNFARAFMLAQEAIQRMPSGGTAVFSVCDRDKSAAAKTAKMFYEMGYDIAATAGTAAFLQNAGIKTRAVNKVKEGRPHIVDMIVSGEAALVINTEGDRQTARRDSFAIRRAALLGKVIYFTTIASAQAAAEGLREAQTGKHPPRALQSWHK
ncbi:MAG: carbamoyl-phosphate synthase large subunit [Gammaproteobacteria bacterium]